MREGASCAQLRRNWLGSDLIYHPLVFWDCTRTRVLVMERIYGISIRELDQLRALGVDFRVLSERGVEIFRSEEHTSELQSLMRNSYAVFCLKKKKTKHNNK